MYFRMKEERIGDRWCCTIQLLLNNKVISERIVWSKPERVNRDGVEDDARIDQGPKR